MAQYLDVPNNIPSHLTIKARPLYFKLFHYNVDFNMLQS